MYERGSMVISWKPPNVFGSVAVLVSSSSSGFGRTFRISSGIPRIWESRRGPIFKFRGRKIELTWRRNRGEAPSFFRPSHVVLRASKRVWEEEAIQLQREHPSLKTKKATGKGSRWGISQGRLECNMEWNERNAHIRWEKSFLVHRALI